MSNSDAWDAELNRGRLRIAELEREVIARSASDVALRSHLERYRTVVLSIASVVWTCDGRGEMVGEQPSWAAYTGQSEKEYQGQGFREAAHLDDRANSEQLWKKSVLSGQPYWDEQRLRDRMGAYRHFLVTAVPIFEATGEIREWAGLHIDITERKLTEQVLRDGQRSLRELADAMPQIVWSSDAAGAYDYFNRRWYELTGIEESLETPESLLSIIHPEDAPGVAERWREALSSGHDYEIECRLRGKDNKYKRYLTRAVPVRDSSGMITRWLGTCTDIDDRKRIDEQLCQAQKMDAIGSLAGGVAHDFNNLLSVILGYSELLTVRIADDHPMRDDLNEIHAAGLRAADLTRQLLHFSHHDIARRDRLDLNQILAELEKMLRRVIGEDVELTLIPAFGIDMIFADRGRIEQVIMNLTVNARDAMSAGGKLTIETANVRLDEKDAAQLMVKPGPHVVLTVTDSGVGMDAPTQSRMFEPFFTTKAVGKGTGLGLSTVFGIVRQAEGSISATSEPGLGTTFRVLFPVASGSRAPKTSSQPIADHKHLTGSETILVVEDDRRVREVVCAILRKYGYEVLSAQSGGDALIVLEQHRLGIDLLLTDVVMPHMSGPQLASRLCAMTPTMKVIYMSGYTGSSALFRLLQESGATFLQKPITGEKLAGAVREALDAVAEPDVADAQ